MTSGLDEAKQSLMERIIWPDTHPESRGGGGGIVPGVAGIGVRGTCTIPKRGDSVSILCGVHVFISRMHHVEKLMI